MKTFATIFLLMSCCFWSCEDQTVLSNTKEILSFTVPGETEPAIIISNPAAVNVVVDSNINLSIIQPLITISEGASINPTSEQSVDFSQGSVNYIVTAEDKSTKVWSVTIENKKSDEAKILSFLFDRLQEGETIINDTNVEVNLKQGVDLSNLKPTIIVSENATVSPASGEAVDFSSGPVVYSVTAHSGKVQQWFIDAKHSKIYEAEIISYSIPEQIGEAVFDGWKITLEVPVGTDVSSITPTIVTSEGTTIEPQSGEAVDFSQTGYVDYKVHTEIGTYKNWRVIVMEEVIKPNNQYVQYMGRINFDNPLKPRLHSSGASIKTKFQGTYCQILIEDQNRWGSYNNYIEIIVDNNDPIRMQTPDGPASIDIVSGLSDGEHTLMIVKDTEADIGYIDFLGFRAESLLEPDALPSRKIEFIGNSITCGYGADDSDIACGTGEWYDQHNAYYAYGPEVARRLGAQWMLSSVSGIGLIHSCCDKTYEMPDVYEKVDFSTSGEPWNFSLYEPQIVTICLGQNDGVQDSAAFVSAYIDFIGTIRNYNPDAEIICLTSPMADETLFAAQQKYLSGVVDYLTAQGDAKIHKLYLSHGFISGCDTHPDKAEHQQVANEIEAFINSTISW